MRGDNSYKCWLNFGQVGGKPALMRYEKELDSLCVLGEGPILQTVKKELSQGLERLTGKSPAVEEKPSAKTGVIAALNYGDLSGVDEEGYAFRFHESDGKQQIVISSPSARGLLYGTFAFLRELQRGRALEDFNLVDNPKNQLRMLNHWDSFSGAAERGYAGRSIYFRDNQLTDDLERIEDYARLLASIGINAVAVNNVNVHYEETTFIAERLGLMKTLADIFRPYGVSLFLSVNYASSIQLGGLDTADPLDRDVRNWWKQQTAKVYEQIPDLGGFLVKADSEFRPGPFTYGRNHADGANMLGRALEPFGGVLIWRCFVYDCQQDWRDHQTDRARAAYDHFQPLDGEFLDNVVLQIKNGPMDFQVREPVSPLFGKLEKTNQILELQITQEYTGQQKHLCYLVPQWKEIFDFDTHARGSGSTVSKVLSGSIFPQTYSGVTAVANIGDDPNWTGHTLAQANWYGYGRLAWDPDLSAEQITEEWVLATFGSDPKVVATVSEMLLKSWEVYENYNAPLGIGWMCNVSHHFGPSVDGYEYSKWGTYHRADHLAIGVDRTVQNGTGFTGQYHRENFELYESQETCPEELLLFFHRIPYNYRLKSGKTLLQHIYDTHFLGVEQVQEMVNAWRSLEGKIDAPAYSHILARLEGQVEYAKEWRDVINTYFYRISGIDDQQKRKIY